MSWKYNPFTGTISDYIEEDEASEESLSAKRLEIDKIATGSIGYLQLVTLVAPDYVSTAGVSTTSESTVFGLAINDAADGEIVRVLLFGHYDDVSLTFALNESLYQDANGDITNVATTIVGESWSRIGRSYGGGSIFIDPEPPVEVQA